MANSDNKKSPLQGFKQISGSTIQIESKVNNCVLEARPTPKKTLNLRILCSPEDGQA